MMRKRRAIKIISIKTIDPSLIELRRNQLCGNAVLSKRTFVERTTVYLLFKCVNIKYLTLNAELRVLFLYRNPRPKSLCRILGSPEVSVIVGKQNKTVSLVLYTPRDGVIIRSLIIVLASVRYAVQCVSIRVCCFCSVHV